MRASAYLAVGLLIWGQALDAQERPALLFIDAVMPIEMLPVDPALADGKIWVSGPHWDSPKVALQPARSPRAIVTTDDKGSRTLILAQLRPDPANEAAAAQWRVAEAWCETTRNRFVTPCYLDQDKDGTLETMSVGVSPVGEPLGVNALVRGQPIKPIRYRAASEAELPRFQIGYAACRGVGAITFATLIRRVTGDQAKGQMQAANCGHIAVPLGDAPDGGTLYRFDRFVVRVRQTADGLDTHLVEGLRPGTILGHVRADQVLTDADASPGLLATAKSRDTIVPLVHFTTLPKVTEGAVAEGGEIVSGDIAHNYSGHLSTPMEKAGFISQHRALPVGSPVYGIPVTGAGSGLEPVILWCAPMRDELAKWTARCFPRGSFGFVSVAGLSPAFLIRSIMFQESGIGSVPASAPIVARGAVDFGGPLHMSLRFKRWTRRFVEISALAAPDGGSADATTLQLPRQADGSAVVVLGEGRLLLRPVDGDKGAAVTVEKAVPNGAEAIPEAADE
jgi:hypothetical protein